MKEGKTGQDGELILVDHLVHHRGGQDPVPVPVQPPHLHQHQAVGKRISFSIRLRDITVLLASDVEILQICQHQPG
jgi:hypothetical protein